ncbi:hypothetical protein ONZ51_g2699 [Trametes cubensis]|uniref:DUF6533 domain-containing protein n=1 Tax=Trametes cubensis TaxID=1111947 RepID=A0AAD7XE97_9APHY|nr:hypothetical protein ONZ51_g2699 [Trametes cubensis]
MDPTQISETIAIYQSIRTGFSCNTAVTSMYAFESASTRFNDESATMRAALVVYNWLINLDDEVKLFWSSPVKGASLLYFAIRYSAFVEPILGIPTFYSLSDKVRSDFSSSAHTSHAIVRNMIRHFGRALQWMGILADPAVYIATAIFSANRAYALSEQTRLIYCVVLVLALSPFLVNLIDGVVWTTIVNLPAPMFCSFEDNTPTSLNHLCEEFPRLTSQEGHLIVIVVTWRATYKVLRETRGLLKTSITQVLLLNGALYFIVLLLLNVGHLIMTELSLTIPVEATSYLTIFIDPLMSILATDFLLKLQKATVMLSHADSDPSGPGELPSLNFAVITQSDIAGTVPDVDNIGVPDV